MINKCLMCNNCEEIYKNSLKIYNFKNFLFETKNFIVNVDSYPVAKNHILIIPKEHYTSFANIDIFLSDELEYVINKILCIFNAKNYIMFENVTNIIDINNKIANNNIYHAHLNIMPNIDIDSNIVLENIKFKKSKNINSFLKVNDKKYFLNFLKYDLYSESNYLLFVSNHDYYYIQESELYSKIESQFFRKILANIFNEGVYNWKDNNNFEQNKDLYKKNIDLTLYEFKNNNIDLVPFSKIKLVRDNIVDIIKKKGRNVNYYIAENDEEYLFFLKNKLKEECNEFIESLSIDNKHIIEECADVLEVIENILSLKNLSFDDINDIKNKKNIKNGSFKKRHILIKPWI